MPLIRIASFTKANRSSILADLVRSHGLTGFTPMRAQTGKPYLQVANGRKAGLAICHVRTISAPFSLMAVSDEPSLGIDAEAWREGQTDETFLRSIAAPEDAPLIARLRKKVRDPATLLWVLKEAALKASGEVMVDPRNLTVGLSTNGHIEASSSATSTAPLLGSNLRLFELSIQADEPSIWVALAITSLQRPKNAADFDVVVDDNDISLREFIW